MSMLKKPAQKYRAYPVLNLQDRTWPNQTLSKAPIWCSSDLRDGNQSLIEPMSPEKKLRFFKTPVQVGIKALAVHAAQLLKKYAAQQPDTDWRKESLFIDKQQLKEKQQQLKESSCTN